MTIRRLALACLAFAAFAAPAHAQLFRAYLSSTGSDANPCTLAAPCRLLPAALNAVASGGEIWMLDSANYNSGKVNIAKTVSIASVPGAQGSLVNINNSTAVEISTPGIQVALRNVFVVPVAGTQNGFGIFLTADARLTLDHCVLAGLPDDAIRVHAGRLTVLDSVIRDSGNQSIRMFSQSGTTTLDITGSRIVNNIGGISITLAGGSVEGSISETSLSGYGSGAGLTVGTEGPISFATAKIAVMRSRIFNFSTGISASASGGAGVPSVSLAASQVSGNSLGLFQSGAATLLSYGDNVIAYNTTATSGTIGTANPQ